MKIGITKQELPIVIHNLLRNTGCLIFGIGIGMVIANRCFPGEVHKPLHRQFNATAVTCMFSGTILASVSGPKKRRKDSVDETSVA
jgi:hypothetical protein